MRQHQDYPRYLRVAFLISHSRCPHALVSPIASANKPCFDSALIRLSSKCSDQILTNSVAIEKREQNEVLYMIWTKKHLNTRIENVKGKNKILSSEKVNEFVY